MRGEIEGRVNQDTARTKKGSVHLVAVWYQIFHTDLSSDSNWTNNWSSSSPLSAPEWVGASDSRYFLSDSPEHIVSMRLHSRSPSSEAGRGNERRGA